ncbi:MAG: hypothetical protein J6T10_20535 [Methanobrevibacter sp.]|nr:hypothetical protein [Methanobrevibacter sp.]
MRTDKIKDLINKTLSPNQYNLLIDLVKRLDALGDDLTLITKTDLPNYRTLFEVVFDFDGLYLGELEETFASHIKGLNDGHGRKWTLPCLDEQLYELPEDNEWLIEDYKQWREEMGMFLNKVYNRFM